MICKVDALALRWEESLYAESANNAAMDSGHSAVHRTNKSSYRHYRVSHKG